MLGSLDYNSLMERNVFFCSDFKKSSLMRFTQEKNNSPNKKTKLLDCIQLFSDHFQNSVMLKHIFNEDPVFKKISLEHLDDEYNHNTKLMNDRDHRAPIWDPVIEACASWFSWQMMILDNVEKVTLMHLVLEASADIFFKEADLMFSNENTDYFKLHCELDEYHSEMGLKVLKGLREEEYNRCFDVQEKGWGILVTTCNRIAAVVNG